MTFGMKLKKLRKDKQLSMAELGKILNLHESTISKYEMDLVEPKMKTVIKICEYFQVTSDYLLCISDN